ncbi:MAG TPA: c-type cytochrome [Solirubrobacteraceae bacterium]|nr:c-type cytochrome [Solirubrobacteraceae bacterium]
MRVATAAAGGLAIAAVAMGALAFTAGGTGEEQAAAPPATAVPANRGLEVWAAQGCGSCHTLAAANAHGVIGPDLASSVKGVPASYLKESIVAPDKTAAAGYSTGMMPEDYAARIAPDDLDRLVGFLMANARR